MSCCRTCGGFRPANTQPNPIPYTLGAGRPCVSMGHALKRYPKTLNPDSLDAGGTWCSPPRNCTMLTWRRDLRMATCQQQAPVTHTTNTRQVLGSRSAPHMWLYRMHAAVQASRPLAKLWHATSNSSECCAGSPPMQHSHELPLSGQQACHGVPAALVRVASWMGSNGRACVWRPGPSTAAAAAAAKTLDPCVSCTLKAEAGWKHGPVPRA